MPEGTLDGLLDRCMWQVIMSDPDSSTRKDALEYNNPTLMNCYHCTGMENQKYGCELYRSYIKLMTNARKDQGPQ